MIGFDQSLLDAFKTVEVRIEDLERGGRYTRTAGGTTNMYRLRNRHAVPTRRDVLSTSTEGREGSVWPYCTVDHFGTEVEILSTDHSRYYLLAALSGALEVAGPNGKAEAHGTKGLIHRGLLGARLVTSDASTRLVVRMDATRLERMLQARFGEPSRDMLAFAPSIDWSSGPGRVVWRMIMRLLEELRDPEGVMSDPVARETFNDLFLQTVLSRLQHNHTARLERPAGAAIPRHVRRAEAFMHAAADQPISMDDVAAAAGCGTTTLYAAFRQFRDTTPLAALHGIRLRRVREALQATDDDVSTRSIARRFGFTNPSRFIAAYSKQFGERTNETRRRGPGAVVTCLD
jgi:AraC-like DNA-binding protein